MTEARSVPLGGGTSRKSTLFCAACDHESPVDGDWVLADHASGTAYVCPDCGHTLTVRRGTGDAAGDADDHPVVTLAATPVRLWTDYVEAVSDATTAWTAGD